jgi:dihydroorotase (multifunctional complex type)
LIVDTVLNNAKAYLKGEIVDCSLAIEEGKINKIGKETQMPKSDVKINLHNLLVLPGLIDAHVHLRDEGRAYKEDFISGTSAAAAGGFASVLDMPNNEPVTMSVEALKNRMNLAEKRALVNVGLYSEFPADLRQVSTLVSQGVVAFKLFMGAQVGGLNHNDDQALKDGLKAAGESGAIVAVHAEDQVSLWVNEQKLKQAKHDRPADFLFAHSEEAENKAIQRLLKASDQTKTHIHFCHVTSRQGLDAVDEAKKAGRKVTCEVTPNHLLLSSAEVTHYGMMAIIAPPLRDRSHQEALWNGVTSGVVDSLGSDHAPHTIEEKSASSVWEVKVGVPGLETSLPLMLTMIKKNRLTLPRMIELLAENPAQIFGLKDKGRLERGLDADLTVIDYKRNWTIDASKFLSKAKFSPYNGWEVTGKPVKTIVNGVLVMDEGEIVAKSGSGKLIRGGKREVPS